MNRTSLPDGYFHVYCRGVCGRSIFPTPADRTALLALARACGRRHPITYYAACVMSTHYHLVLEATVSALSAALHWLNGRYARRFNKNYDAFGHVFADRFGARALEGEDRVFDTCAYVLQNPVKAGLCERSEDWPWSWSRFGRSAM